MEKTERGKIRGRCQRPLDRAVLFGFTLLRCYGLLIRAQSDCGIVCFVKSCAVMRTVYAATLRSCEKSFSTRRGSIDIGETRVYFVQVVVKLSWR